MLCPDELVAVLSYFRTSVSLSDLFVMFYCSVNYENYGLCSLEDINYQTEMC